MVYQENIKMTCGCCATELKQEEGPAESKRGKVVKLFIAFFLIFIFLFGYLGLMRHG